SEMGAGGQLFKGLLSPLRNDFTQGTGLAQQLGLVHYDAPLATTTRQKYRTDPKVHELTYTQYSLERKNEHGRITQLLQKTSEELSKRLAQRGLGKLKKRASHE